MIVNNVATSHVVPVKKGHYYHYYLFHTLKVVKVLGKEEIFVFC